MSTSRIRAKRERSIQRPGASVFYCVAALACFQTTTLAQSPVEELLNTKYKAAGQDTVLVVRGNGILTTGMNQAQVVPNSTFREGRIHPPGVLSALAAAGGQAYQPLAPGAQVYLVKIDVNARSDKFTFLVYECNPCTGGLQNSFTRASVAFQFAKGTFKTATAAQAEDMIGQVFSIAQPQAAPPSVQQEAPPAPIPTAAPMQRPPDYALGTYVGTKFPTNSIQLNGDGSFGLLQDGKSYAGTFSVEGQRLTLAMNGKAFAVAELREEKIFDTSGEVWGKQGSASAPPPEPASAPKTIALGQTTNEVVDALGQPARIAKAGAKEIYFYKDLKITFVNGKVSDVQ